MKGKDEMNERRNDVAGFPQELTAEMLRGFVTTERGCTHPRVGEIDGRRYIAKCGIWSRHSSDEHVLNELAADAFLREAGLYVPASKEYRVDFGAEGEHVVRLAEFKVTTPLGDAWENGDDSAKAKIREQVLAAYPYISLIAGIDTFTYDNVRVDQEGRLWFVDNGSSFDFRACGLRKGWFWQRSRVDDPHSGYISLARNRHQGMLRRLLGGVDGVALWVSAANADLARLASALPRDYARAELIAYIRAVAAFAARIAANPPPPRTELVFVLDRSGSMCGRESDVIGGFNSLLEKQKKEAGECKVSTVLFDDRMEVLHRRMDIQCVAPISGREYNVRGCTALLDALGHALMFHIDVQRRAPENSKADKVVFAVVTDGMENASRMFTPEMVRSLVKRQTEEGGWEFLFLGANIDAVTAAADIGIRAERAVRYHCDSQGLDTTYDAVSRAVSNVRRHRHVEDLDERGDSWRTYVDRDFGSR